MLFLLSWGPFHFTVLDADFQQAIFVGSANFNGIYEVVCSSLSGMVFGVNSALSEIQVMVPGVHGSRRRWNQSGQ